MLVSVYYFLPQPKGYLGVHSPPYGGGVGGRGTSMSFITYVIMTSVHYVIMASASFCLSLWLLSFMSLWLLHHSVCHCGFCPLCHYVFCIILSVILASVHYVIMASVPLLLCLLHTLSIMSSVHSVWFRGFLCKVFLRTY